MIDTGESKRKEKTPERERGKKDMENKWKEQIRERKYTEVEEEMYSSGKGKALTVKEKDSWQFERDSDGRSRGWPKGKEEIKRGYGRKTETGKRKWMGKGKEIRV